MMTFRETKEMVVRIIHEGFARRGITIKRLILFGSQVRGTAKADSDWDFIAVIDSKLDWQEKREIWHSLALLLAKEHISAEVLIKSEDEFSRDLNDKGKVTYYAHKEGLVL
jgi:predicted nucleotidyltransferase